MEVFEVLPFLISSFFVVVVVVCLSQVNERISDMTRLIWYYSSLMYSTDPDKVYIEKKRGGG